MALSLAKIFDADIWTTNYNTVSAYPEFGKFKVNSHPLVSSRFLPSPAPLRFVWQGLMQAETARYFRHLKLNDYTLIISAGMGAKQVSLSAINHPCLHYEHGVKDSYSMEWLFKPFTSYMKNNDRKATAKVDKLLCNSMNTKNKITGYYHRDAEVVYPSVNIKAFHGGTPGDYFLSVQRISQDKRIETQLEAFRMTPEHKLIIVGPIAKTDKQYAHDLVSGAPPNVTFRGGVNEQELIDLYSHAKAVIQSHPHEDFGIVTVEAMASGKPCFAVNAGGFKETIVHTKTGLLIDIPFSENLAKAIKNFNPGDFNPADCVQQARKFSEDSFCDRIRQIVKTM